MKLKLNKKDYMDILTKKKTIIVEYGKIINSNIDGQILQEEGKFENIKLENFLSLLGVKLSKFSDEIIEYLSENKMLIRIKYENEQLLYSYVDRYTDEVSYSSNNFNDLTEIALCYVYKSEKITV